MQRELSAYFEDIVLSIDKIERYTMGMSKEMLNRNEMILDAPLKQAVMQLQGGNSLIKNERRT